MFLAKSVVRRDAGASHAPRDDVRGHLNATQKVASPALSGCRGRSPMPKGLTGHRFRAPPYRGDRISDPTCYGMMTGRTRAYIGAQA